MERLYRMFGRKKRIIRQVTYLTCFFLCTSCFNNMIKYHCDTHCIYSEEGYNLSHLYFEDSTNVLSLYKKDGIEKKTVNVYNIYDYFDIDSTGLADTIRILPNMKYCITNQSSMDATGQSITLFTDSVGNIICPY